MSDTRKRTIHGVSIGILMVKTAFTRFPGDVGNAETWDFPVQYKIVNDAVPARMGQLHNSSLLKPFKRAAHELIEEGVDGITTTCGFLSIYQKELADSCSVPVATSSLLQVPLVQRLIPAGKVVGIVTFSASLMNRAYLDHVGVTGDSPIIGMPETSEFVRCSLAGDTSVPFEVIQQELLDTVARLLSGHPTVGAIVLECTNMTPYSYAIVERFGLPVYDAVSMIRWFRHGLRPRRYA
jgi:Asp/Glu/hydantoin racemase